MVWIYDIETFVNYFSVIFKNPKSKEVKEFIIFKERNDFEQIVTFITDRNKWLVGYNSYNFDNQLLSYMYNNQLGMMDLSSDIICNSIYKVAKAIISEESYSEYKYNLPFQFIDLMKAGNLMMKSLKLVGVSLKWHKLQDLPIDWDKEITKEDVEMMKLYNLNDVEMTEKLYNHLQEALKMRFDISKKYNINAYTESDSGIANKLLEKFYKETTKLDPKAFKQLRTNRPLIRFRDVVFPNIHFKSEILDQLLTDINEFTYYESKPFFNKSIVYGGIKYKLGIGGLHSQDKGGIFEANNKEEIIDADISSYYPNIIINHNIHPKHLSEKFIHKYEEIKELRLKAKKKGDMTTSDTLKITINSVFGKMLFKNHWLYDPLAGLKITINGQLYLLMLIEQLVIAGFNVISANTDGIIAIIPKDKKYLYNKICQDWEKQTNFDLEYTHYSKYIRKDVNNYISITTNGKEKQKGIFFRRIDLKKGFDKPIISLALFNYFIHDISIGKTITNHTDIYDFCVAKKIDNKFKNEFVTLKNGTKKVDELQKSVRFYVSTDGGKLYKRDDENKVIDYCVNKRVTIFNDFTKKKMSNYNIDYNYYIGEAYKIIHQIKDFQLKLF